MNDEKAQSAQRIPRIPARGDNRSAEGSRWSQMEKDAQKVNLLQLKFKAFPFGYTRKGFNKTLCVYF